MHLYFETQSYRNCAVHGVNNYFQEEILTCRELDLVKIWIKENYAANRDGNWDHHFTDDGFFAADTLLRYIEEKFGNPRPTILGSVGTITREKSIAILRDNDRVLAVHLSAYWKHTVAAIKKDKAWYLLDSVKSAPSGPHSQTKLLRLLNTFTLFADTRPAEIPSTDTGEVIEIDSKMCISSLHRFVR